MYMLISTLIRTNVVYPAGPGILQFGSGFVEFLSNIQGGNPKYYF